MASVPAGLKLPNLKGALPQRPDDYHLLHRFCLRVYGLLTRDISRQAEALAQAAGPGVRKKNRQLIKEAVEEELPVLMALYSLERLAMDQLLDDEGVADLVRSQLLSCFSLSYLDLYDKPDDPLKHVFNRVDWYLDGDKGDPLNAFVQCLVMVLGDKLGDPDLLLRHLNTVLLPELDQRLELAYRYDFS